MKKFLFALLCVLLTAGFAFAVDVDLKGMYNVRGSYIDNSSGVSGDAFDYMYYDMELDLTTRILVSDKTRIIVNMEIHDENWATDGVTNQDDREEETGRGLDDNIHFKRVFSSHTFDAYGTVLDLGLMTGGAWATGFGDNARGKYRVKVMQPTELGPIFAILEKNAEVGSGGEDFEKDDGDAYYLAMVTKLGDFSLMPLLGYVDASNAVRDAGSDGIKQILVLLGANATFGDIGFEAEFNYVDIDQSDVPSATTPGGFREDYSTFCAYGKGWWNIGAGQVGLLAAYGSWDDDAGDGFGFGEDFTPTVFGADWTNIGGNQIGSSANVSGALGREGSEYKAVTMIQIFGSLALSEELSISGAGLYWASNAGENNDGSDNYWKDADGYEINAGLAWKLTDMATYSIAAGFGKISLDDGGSGVTDDSPDSFARVYHKFQIDF